MRALIYLLTSADRAPIICFNHNLILSERINLECLRRQIRVDGFQMPLTTSHQDCLSAIVVRLEGVDSSRSLHFRAQTSIGA